jgi:hypothetical protein
MIKPKKPLRFFRLRNKTGPNKRNTIIRMSAIQYNRRYCHGLQTYVVTPLPDRRDGYVVAVITPTLAVRDQELER